MIVGQLQLVRVERLRHAPAGHDIVLVVVDDGTAEADLRLSHVQPDAVPARLFRDPAAASGCRVHLTDIDIRQPGTSGYYGCGKMQSIAGQSVPLKGIGNGLADRAWSKLLYQGQANE